MPKKLILVRFFILLLATLSASVGILNIAIYAFVIDAVSLSKGFDYTFTQTTLLQYYPLIGIPPIINLVISSWYLYLFLKTKNSNSWRLYSSIVVTIIVSPAIIISSYLILSQTFLLDFRVLTESKIYELIVTVIQSTVFSSSPVILCIIVLILLSERHIKNIHLPLSKNQRMVLTLISILIYCPVIAIYGYAYSRTYTDKDLGYNKAQSNVSFKLLKPSHLPDGYVQSNAFNVRENESTNQSMTQVVFEKDMVYTIYNKKNYDEQPSGFFAITQELSNLENIDRYSITSLGSFPTELTRKPIDLPNAKDQKGIFLVRQSDKQNYIYQIIFLTNDRSIVHLTTYNLDQKYLIEVAKNLQ